MFGTPARTYSMLAVLPMLLSLGCLALAEIAAPRVSSLNNPVFVLCSLVLGASCTCLIAPLLLKWNWNTKYFGVISFYLASVSLLGIVPLLSILIFGTAPTSVSTLAILAYVLPNVAWCTRCIRYYRKINNNAQLAAILYQHEADASYYIQKGDRYLSERKRGGYNPYPPASVWLAAVGGALLLTPFAATIATVTGLSFSFAFLSVLSLPICMMGLGFATQGWLVFYHFPMLIRRKTGNRVYVDMQAPYIPPTKSMHSTKT